MEAFVDGHPVGIRSWARCDRAFELTLRITTTLVEQLEGKRYDAGQRRPVRVAAS